MEHPGADTGNSKAAPISKRLTAKSGFADDILVSALNPRQHRPVSVILLSPFQVPLRNRRTLQEIHVVLKIGDLDLPSDRIFRNPPDIGRIGQGGEHLLIA